MKQGKWMLLFLAVMLLCSACSTGYDEMPDERRADGQEDRLAEETERLAEGYQEIYEEAVEEGSEDSLELKQGIVDYLGEAGYAASDRDDQINMANYEQAEAFCEKARRKEAAELTLFSVLDEGRLIRYDMETADGRIHVALRSLQWKEGEPEVYYSHEYEAYTWEYTDKGFLFIEEYQPAGYDGPPGRIGFRIKPLDQRCRELNRKYVLPVGYTRNNLLVTDWDETDYAGLELYDLYEILYRVKYGDYVPYSAYEGAEYEIPEAEFEEVLQTFFQIDSQTIRAKTVYHPDRRTYRYRPRGLHDAELPYGPYPEVTACEEQADGTICLTVEAVWERKGLDSAVRSELVVRPLENGSFQYVSNAVQSWDEGLEFVWYSPRLTDEEWDAWYGAEAMQQ